METQRRDAVDLALRPDEQREPEDEEEVADDAPRQRAAHDLEEPVVDREEGDDQLGRVPEGRVEEAADARARVLGGVLGRLADQPGERDERDRCEDEERDFVGIDREPDDDRERREAERCPEEPTRHEGQAYRGAAPTPCLNPIGLSRLAQRKSPCPQSL